MTTSTLRLTLATFLSLILSTHADDSIKRESIEATVSAPVATVWELFTTADGMKKWMAPKVDIELKVGGKIRSSYSPTGELGDDKTIENTIIAFDPHHMLSMRNTKAPEGFPFPKAIAKSWSVIYLEEISEKETKVTLVSLGQGDDAESKEMRAYFKKANAGLLEKLKRIAGEK